MKKTDLTNLSRESTSELIVSEAVCTERISSLRFYQIIIGGYVTSFVGYFLPKVFAGSLEPSGALIMCYLISVLAAGVVALLDDKIAKLKAKKGMIDRLLTLRSNQTGKRKRQSRPRARIDSNANQG